MSLAQQTYTFAAVCQTAKLVQDIARTSQCDSQAFETMLNSIVVTSPEQTSDVYGGDLGNLTTGLLAVRDQLGNSSKPKDPELTRYIVSILALERKLSKNATALKELGHKIDQTKRQTDHFDLTSETVVASFAGIYSDVISPLGARIQVTGEPNILKSPVNQHKIRALLLAGVRSAVLWRQVGGKRRNIVFSRSKILNCTEQLLKEI